MQSVCSIVWGSKNISKFPLSELGLESWDVDSVIFPGTNNFLKLIFFLSWWQGEFCCNKIDVFLQNIYYSSCRQKYRGGGGWAAGQRSHRAAVGGWPWTVLFKVGWLPQPPLEPGNLRWGEYWLAGTLRSERLKILPKKTLSRLPRSRWC